MAAVIAEKFPDKAPQLFAYLRRLYRRQVSARHSLDWAQEDSDLYNEAFVGHAKARQFWVHEYITKPLKPFLKLGKAKLPQSKP